jgi:ATP-dependent 26S proteasome regulatory subunit
VRRRFYEDDLDTPRHEQIYAWIQQDYLPEAIGRSGDHTFVWSESACAFRVVLDSVAPDAAFEGFRFAGYQMIDCPVISVIRTYQTNGKCGFESGARLLRFEREGETFEILLAASYGQHQHSTWTILACVPQAHVPVWLAFEQECTRILDCMSPDGEVIVIGGRTSGFSPTVSWDDVVLPHELKTNLMRDVEGFFTKGVEIYKRINLKPFRKLLLAGVPGTGKTMICSSLARWALNRNYLVIYVSASDREGEGSMFWKIHEALETAAKSRYPTLLLVEELDLYLNEKEKAQVLNALDGAEAPLNDCGTLLVSTTNHPEVIDDRILKRPGRLDRIFVIPEMRDPQDATRILKHYLGAYWRDEHEQVVPELVGRPGAFIREVAVHALTQAAYDELDTLSLDLLESSMQALIAQIEARDDFIRQKRDFGLLSNGGSRR